MKQSIIFSFAFFFCAFLMDTVEAQTVNGRNVVFVKFGNSSNQFMGSFAYKGQKRWEEEGTKLGVRNFVFEEVNRDDWSVYLQDNSRGVKIQLDLHTKKVMYSDANTPKREQYNIIKSYSKIDGRIATKVNFGNASGRLGTFVMRNTGDWVEKSDATGQVAFRFKETHRDDWSVYLFDESRGVRLQLDLHTRKVMYSDQNNPTARPLYEIIAAK